MKRIFSSHYIKEFDAINADTFAVGQITDLHARQAIHGSSVVPSRRSRDVFALLPEAINLLKSQGADFLAVTGDLLDVPNFILEPNDYYDMNVDEWLPLVEADYRLLKEILDGAGLPYMVLPGNHDYEPVMWQVFDKSSHVVDVKAKGHGQTYRMIRFCDREWARNIPRRFDRERKLWMQMLTDTQGPPQIHLQHYVIAPQLTESYPYNYLESKHLLEQITRSRQVILSLSGHYHHGHELLDFDGCHFSVGAAFSEFPHPVQIYEIAEGTVTTEQLPLVETPYGASRKVVFLDRDGVINDCASYSTGPEQMSLIPGSAQAILSLRQAGYAVVVITNQTAVGMGHVSPQTVDMVHERMCQLLVETVQHVDAQPDLIVYATGAGNKAIHATFMDNSFNKPSPALMKQAAALLGLEKCDAWIVGDRVSDLQAGLTYGATPFLVRTGQGRQTEEELRNMDIANATVCDHLSGAVATILGR